MYRFHIIFSRVKASRTTWISGHFSEKKQQSLNPKPSICSSAHFPGPWKVTSVNSWNSLTATGREGSIRKIWAMYIYKFYLRALPYIETRHLFIDSPSCEAHISWHLTLPEVTTLCPSKKSSNKSETSGIYRATLYNDNGRKYVNLP